VDVAGWWLHVCMFVCMFSFVFICHRVLNTHTHTHTHTYPPCITHPPTQLPTHPHPHPRTYTHTNTHTHTHICMSHAEPTQGVCNCVRVCERVHVFHVTECACVRADCHTYTHIHTHTLSLTHTHILSHTHTHTCIHTRTRMCACQS